MKKQTQTAQPKSQGSRRPRIDAQRNRERILEVAKKAFLRHGAEASLDDMAKRAGVGPGTLYRHFPSRELLIEAVYRSEVEKLGAAQRRLSGEMTPLQALRTWMLLLVELIETKKIIAPALRALLGQTPNVFAATRGQIQESVEALVRNAVRSGDIRKDIVPFDLVLAVIGFSNFAAGPDWGEHTRKLIDILIAGCRQESSSDTSSGRQ